MDDTRLRELLRISSKSKIKTKVIAHTQLRRLKPSKLPLYLVVHFGSRLDGHWTSFYIPKVTKQKPDAYMIDSFAMKFQFYHTRPPPFRIKARITKQIQDSRSSLCALYSWFFLYRLAENYSIKSTLALFGSNTVANDNLVKAKYRQFVKKYSPHFKTNLSPRFACICKDKFVRLNS